VVAVVVVVVVVSAMGGSAVVVVVAVAVAVVGGASISCVPVGDVVRVDDTNTVAFVDTLAATAVVVVVVVLFADNITLDSPLTLDELHVLPVDAGIVLAYHNENRILDVFVERCCLLLLLLWLN
jgi:flagellar motor component MotA